MGLYPSAFVYYSFMPVLLFALRLGGVSPMPRA